MRLIDADAFVQMMEEKCDPESTLDPWVLSVCRGGVKMMPTMDAVLVERIEELEQLDYELYCRTGKSHLNEQQWEWLKGVLKNETD